MEEQSVLHRRAPLNDDTLLAVRVPRKATLQIARGTASQTPPPDSDGHQLVYEATTTVTVRLPNGEGCTPAYMGIGAFAFRAIGSV